MSFVRGMYKKSLLIEIVDRNNPSRPVEAFTLTVPPESIEIQEPQRVSYTKTFGGVVEDDYGPDTLDITISGNTGGSDLRQTFIPPGITNPSPDGFDGRMAFYYLRDKLMRYKSRTSYQTRYDQFEIRLYDLGTMPEGPEGYVVSLKSFKMRRNKNQPLWYSYTIEFVGIRPLGSFVPSATRAVPTVDVLTLWDRVNKALKTVRTFFGYFSAIRNKVDGTLETMSELYRQLRTFHEQTLDIVRYPSKLAKRVLGQTQAVVDLIQEVGSTFTSGTLGSDQYKDYLDCLAIVASIRSGIERIVAVGKSPEAAGLDKRGLEEMSSRTDSVDDRYAGLSDADAELPSTVSSPQVRKSVVMVHGFTVVTADDTTTLERLAQEFYGDPSLAELIAVYNGSVDVAPGTDIKIPVLVQGKAAGDNQVYAEDLTDVYGRDILLDETGNPVVGESGDFLTIESTANVVQALNLRLNQGLGTRLRLGVYGIKASVGGAFSDAAPIGYILANIQETLMQDPRIDFVDNIRLRGVGDRLYVSLSAHTIKVGDVVRYSGVM